MVRSKKRLRAKHNKVDVVGDVEALARAAAEHLEKQRFRDAVDSYKRLVKAERRSQWVEGLAQAYAGRAEQLALRGMVKEAIALWHNRADACGEPLVEPRYLGWLVATGRTAEAMRHYATADAAMMAGNEGLSRLQARLAAAALAEHGAGLDRLSTGDPVARDYAAAEAALNAYTGGNDEALEAALGRIPFRSPYRDFRQLLKALRRREQDPGAAAELLMRVPADTPFTGLRMALESAVAAGGGLCPNLIAALPSDVLDLVEVLAGWTPNQARLVQPLARLGSAPDDKALFDFILAHRAVLGEPLACEAAYAVAGVDPGRHRRLAKHYRTLPDAERFRLLAQMSEAEDEIDTAAGLWLRYLDASVELADNADNRLRRALVHRHLAELNHPVGASLPMDLEAVNHLELGLELDPEDRDSALALIDHYLHVHDLKAARRWVEQSLAQHPNDAACLLKAARTAVAGGAYKKAARFAHRLIELDPINPEVRGLLVDAGLAHARKQIRAGKRAAAERELDRAAEWARSQVDEGRGQILRGFMASEDGAAAAAELQQQGIARAGGGLVGRFYFVLEARLLQRNLRAATQAAGLPAAGSVGDRDEVLAVIRAVNGLRDAQQHKSALKAVLEALAPAIDRQARADFSREQIELICETLLRYHRYASLKRYAQAALRRWHKAPLFVFYQIQGRLAGRVMAPWMREFSELETACEQAYQEGDSRTAQRIRTVLDDTFPTLPDFDVFDPFEDADDPDNGGLYPSLGDRPDPALLAAIDATLSASERRRLQAALDRGQPLPIDILAKLLSGLGEGTRQPVGDEPAHQRRPRKQRAAKKHSDDEDDAPFQRDLFGDLE